MARGLGQTPRTQAPGRHATRENVWDNQAQLSWATQRQQATGALPAARSGVHAGLAGCPWSQHGAELLQLRLVLLSDCAGPAEPQVQKHRLHGECRAVNSTAKHSIIASKQICYQLSLFQCASSQRLQAHRFLSFLLLRACQVLASLAFAPARGPCLHSALHHASTTSTMPP